MREGVTEGENSYEGYCFSGNAYATFLAFFGSYNPHFDELSQTVAVDAEVAALEKKGRAEDIYLKVACSLFEFYCGALKKVEYERKRHLEGADPEDEF